MRQRWIAEVYRTMNGITAIILVGGPGNSRLRTLVDTPVCVLPVPGHSSLVHGWLDLIARLDVVSNTSILTGREKDRLQIDQQASAWQADNIGAISLLRDQTEHRGTAGTLMDFVNKSANKNDILVIEGTMIPPAHPHKIFDREFFEREDIAGVFGRTDNGQPAGMMLLKRRVLDLVPDIGFFDLKEQLLPRVLERGNTILVRSITDDTTRLSSQENYFDCNKILGARLDQDKPHGPWIHPDAHVHSEVTLGVNVLVGPGARIDPGVVLEDAIILGGAHIGMNSLVIQSIVMGSAKIPANTRLIRSEEYVVDHRKKKKSRSTIQPQRQVETL